MAGTTSLKETGLSEIFRLACDDDWQRRERAGFELRARVERDWNSMLTTLDRWLRDHNDRVRRAAVLACMMRKRYGSSDAIDSLLDRLEIVLNDPSEYVRKCTGPFVLGYLGYTYPTIVLPRLRFWFEQYESGPKHTCWNLASAFSQALGRREPVTAVALLPKLADHHEAVVRRAVARSLVNVARVAEREVVDVCLNRRQELSKATADLVFKKLGIAPKL